MTSLFAVVTVFILFLFVKLYYEIKEKYESKRKKKQLYQLKKIYQFFKDHEKNPEEAKSKLSKDIKIESKWLYTNYFYFDLNEKNFIEKIKKYLLEIMSFYIGTNNVKDKKVLDSLVEFKKELNAMA